MRPPVMHHPSSNEAGACRARRLAGRSNIATATWVLIAVLLLCAFSSNADAQTAARKFGRGLAGMTTSFLEVPGNMVAETQRHGAAEGIPLGFAIGCGMIVPRTLVGVYEFVTAPFPAPAGYKPILHPEFPWSYFEQSGQFRSAAADDRIARAQKSR